MHRAALSLLFILLSLLVAVPAMAGNWGESWGSMVWGSVAAVPTMGWLGGGLLVGLLPGGAPAVRTADIGAAEMPA